MAGRLVWFKVTTVPASTLIVVACVLLVSRRIQHTETRRQGMRRQLPVPGVIMREAQYREVLDSLKRDGVGLGNTPSVEQL
jgi:hypothetical protein